MSVLRNADGRLRSGWVVALYALLCLVGGGAELALFILARGLGVRPPGLGDPLVMGLVALRVAWALGLTWLCCGLVGQRLRDANLGDVRWAARLGWGTLWGVAALSVSVVIPLVAGHEGFTLTEDPPGAVLAGGAVLLVTCALIGGAEEVLFRGFPFQQLARRPGPAAALFLTSAVFGLAHGKNPGATWVAVANILLVGLWLGATVLRTGSVWLAVGIHLGWNFAQGFLWGAPISGFRISASVLERAPPGDPFWSGGAFGPEASISSGAVLALMAVLALVWPRRTAMAVTAPAGESPGAGS